MRVLVLTNLCTGNRMMINTRNIEAINPEVVTQNGAVVCFIGDESFIEVAESFESIMHAWRFGSAHGTAEVFDAPA